MNTLILYGMTLAFSLTAGLNLYITLLVIGFSMRMGWADSLPAGLWVLNTTPFLFVSALLFVVQFIADKIQFVDNLWDSIHTLIRPVGASLLAGVILAGHNPAMIILAIILAGSISLISHSNKATMRMFINVISPFESFSARTISFIEDVLVAGLCYFAIRFPLIAGTLALCLIIMILIFTPRAVRWSFFMFKAILYRFKGVINRIESNEPLPQSHRMLLGNKNPEITISCLGQNIKGAHGRYGFISYVDSTLYFTYNKWLRPRLWHIRTDRIKQTYFRQQILVDIIEIHYLGERDRIRKVRLVFLKDRSLLTEKLASKLSSIPTNK